MINQVHVVAGTCLCLLAVVRVGMVRGSVTARSLWSSLALLGVIETTKVSVVHQAIEQVLHRPGSAALLQHCLTVLAAAAALRLHASLRDRESPGVRRRYTRWAGVAIAAMVGVYAVAPPDHLPPALVGHPGFYDESWWTAAGLTVELAYLTWALAAMLASTRRCAAAAQPGPLRTGLQLGAVGITAGFGYVALKVVVIGVWLSGRGGPAAVAFDELGEALTLSVCLTLIGVGSAAEALAARRAELTREVADRRALRRLRPLLELVQEQGGGYDLPAVTVHQQLIVRVTDVRDGQRRLRAYADPVVADNAAAAARAAGYPNRMVGVLSEAAVLAVGLRRRQDGARRWPSQTRQPTGGRNLAEEVRHLEALAQVCRHAFVDAFALAYVVAHPVEHEEAQVS